MCNLYANYFAQENIAKKEGYSYVQKIANYLRIVLDYCLLGMHICHINTYTRDIQNRHTPHTVV